jgi:hypothetical protein
MCAASHDAEARRPRQYVEWSAAPPWVDVNEQAVAAAEDLIEQFTRPVGVRFQKPPHHQEREGVSASIGPDRRREQVARTKVFAQDGLQYPRVIENPGVYVNAIRDQLGSPVRLVDQSIPLRMTLKPIASSRRRVTIAAALRNGMVVAAHDLASWRT